MSIVASALRSVSPHFQRSINLTYDTGNADYISGYIPTPNGAKALAAVLGNVLVDKRQRSHVLYGAYGSGKSLLGLVLSALASDDPACRQAVSIVLDRLRHSFPATAESVYQYTGKCLLPVIISGNEGELSISLVRALARALQKEKLSDLQSDTQFQAALAVIERWKETYYDMYRQLTTGLSQNGTSLINFINDLKDMQPKALELFENLYTELTGGAQFDRYSGLPLSDAFNATSQALHGVGYDGIIVIWDEFGRFLESGASDAFGSEAASLQSFAEFCNRSGPNQVHLVLIAHRLLPSYASRLPTDYQQEWARIAERFQSHDVSCDPVFSYRLITAALETPDAVAWDQFISEHHSSFDSLTSRSLEIGLFGELDEVTLRQQVVEHAWPLHPLAVYALPRLASQVAQNERTLFTFLASDDPGTFTEYLGRSRDGWWFIGIDAVWDYFAEAIRSDARPGGTHAIWSGVVYALGKVDTNDALTESIIKSLGILLIVGEVNVHSNSSNKHIVPTTELLAWATGVGELEAANCLEMLARHRAVVFRRSEGYWTFTRGSDVDLDAEIHAVIERRTRNHLQMRQLLERVVPPPFQLPRGHNLERRMTRFFWGLYRWPDELKDVCVEDFLKQLGSTGYADGAVVYVLATTNAERDSASAAVCKLPVGRIVYVIPARPLSITEPLRELFALYDLSNNATFMEQDERLPREVDFFIEDAKRRLVTALQPLLKFGWEDATWWSHDGTSWNSENIREAKVSRLLSRLCNHWFGETPVLNNELLNQNEPSGQQVRASEKVIDALLKQPDDRLTVDLNLSGYGPDVLILRTLLISTGLLKPIDAKHCSLVRPEGNPSLAHVWDVIQEFLETAVEDETEASVLVDKLQSPPFGLRSGVLPLLLAAMMRSRLQVLTIRDKRQVVSPIAGETFTALCKNPENYTIELGPWDDQRRILWEVLKERCQDFLVEQERSCQPLRYLGAGLLRWLQLQPRYCRDTNRISQDAQRLRDLIRTAQREPNRVFFYELLELLDSNVVASTDETDYRNSISVRLHRLMDEIADAHRNLLYSLDRFAEKAFSRDSLRHRNGGQTALSHWATELERLSSNELDKFRFSDHLAQSLVDVLCRECPMDDDLFWGRVSEVVLGIPVYDWSDQSIDIFQKNLLDIKERIEREVLELSEDESVIELDILLPDQGALSYRFRPANLTAQGERVLQNFRSTLEVAGRPLSPDERRQIVLELLRHVLGEPRENDGSETKQSE